MTGLRWWNVDEGVCVLSDELMAWVGVGVRWWSVDEGVCVCVLS